MTIHPLAIFVALLDEERIVTRLRWIDVEGDGVMAVLASGFLHRPVIENLTVNDHIAEQWVALPLDVHVFLSGG